MSLFPTIATDAELREVVPETVARAAMKLIGERHRLTGELRACARGSELVYTAGDQHVIKLTDPRWASEIENEAVFLEGLGGALTVRTPQLVARGDIEGWPYVVMTYVPGEHLADVWSSLDAAGRRDVARGIGELMAELHQCSVVGAPEPPWSRFIAEQRAGAIEHHRRRGTAEPWLDAMSGLLESAGDPYDVEHDAVTLHTELYGAHILVERDADRWRVSGLIDFADGMRGRASYDVAALVEFIYQRDTALLGDTLSAAGWPRRLDDDECERLFACALLHRFASLPRMMGAADIDPGSAPDLARLRGRLYAPSA